MIDTHSLLLLGQVSTTQPERLAAKILALIILTAFVAMLGVLIISLLVIAWGRFTRRQLTPRRRRSKTEPLRDQPDIWHESAERLKLDKKNAESDDDNDDAPPQPPAHG